MEIRAEELDEVVNLRAAIGGGCMKVSELTGAELDFYVAKAEGLNTIIDDYGECRIWISPCYRHYSPSTDWSQGGQILEQEGISVEQTDKNPAQWMAIKPHATSNFREDYWYGYGASYLEAAMRCFVASKFGEEVEEK